MSECENDCRHGGYYQRDNVTDFVEEVPESLEEQRREAASDQCPSSQRLFGQEVSYR